MKRIKKKILDFYTNEKELDITFFKLLGTGGILVSLVGAIQAIITIQDYQSAIINAVAMLASLALIWFVHATKRYTLGYLITSVTIFMGLFAWLFFEGGGMNGANPYFFTFGIVFTLMMYRGWLLIVMTGLQIAFYSAVCYISYIHPELVEAYDSPRSQFIDQLSGILISSFGLGVIFMMYIWEYRKQQKVASESSQAKSELLANISHEIRTPINMLLGMNEMILRECENTQIKEYAKNVENAGQHLLFMVNQFLDLSRIDMGKENLFYADFNLLEMMYGLGAFFENEADKKGLEFVLDLDKKTPAYVHGDMQKLSQILSNLLSNAVKYTKAGTIVFSIQPIQEMEDSTVIHFEVSDTGSGISEEDQEKIFESFERADIIRNRSIEGTGLGLAISSKLAEMMGSEIKVKSEYEIGSVFWFDLELKLGDAQEIALNEERSFIAPEVRILVVDDNSMNLTVVKSLFKRTLV
ncbi:MAG: hypothetical protein E7277_08285, partial [Lachnospiraceae bacterium]|nr:hypothetical protein [Lachnospiraceae bacterium]